VRGCKLLPLVGFYISQCLSLIAKVTLNSILCSVMQFDYHTFPMHYQHHAPVSVMMYSVFDDDQQFLSVQNSYEQQPPPAGDAGCCVKLALPVDDEAMPTFTP